MDRRGVTTAVAAGVTGGVMANLAMLLTFRVLGMALTGEGILLDPAVQSRKLIGVWTELQPLPRVVTHPVLMGLGAIGLSVVRAWIYLWLSRGWPAGVVPRALRFGALIWALVYLFWEFFTPLNMFGEPVVLTLLELAFWAVVAFAEAFGTAAVAERLRTDAAAQGA
ncbi:MAG: hypothetical protein U9R79_00710 [Armatimonadota bacterium]|nr:hypothetical protein [Armatimonadota bacterium]